MTRQMFNAWAQASKHTHICPSAFFSISSWCVFLSSKLTPVVHIPFMLQFNRQLGWAPGWDICPVWPLETDAPHCSFSAKGQFYNIKPFHIEFWEVASKVGLWGLKGWRALHSIKDLLTKNLLAINRLINLFVNVSWIPTESSKAMIPVHKPTEPSVVFRAVICNSPFFHNFQCSEFYHGGPAPAQCI